MLSHVEVIIFNSQHACIKFIKSVTDVCTYRAIPIPKNTISSEISQINLNYLTKMTSICMFYTHSKI